MSPIEIIVLSFVGIVLTLAWGAIMYMALEINRMSLQLQINLNELFQKMLRDARTEQKRRHSMRDPQETPR